MWGGERGGEGGWGGAREHSPVDLTLVCALQLCVRYNPHIYANKHTLTHADT